MRSPLGFLLGKTRLEKELKGLTTALDVKPMQAGNTVLRGTPKGMEDRVTQVLIEVTPESHISRIVLQGADDAVTEYRFTEVKEDLPLADNKFQFKPPPGVETIEGELGQ
jgi:outer membrane lipoprotein carrier protein